MQTQNDAVVRGVLLWLAEQGVVLTELPKGTRRSVTGCPIARALRSVYRYTEVGDTSWCENLGPLAQLPTVVQTFIRTFDRREYPQFDITQAQ